MKINHSFQINSLLKIIPPHFLENYFAEVKIKKLKTITNHLQLKGSGYHKGNIAEVINYRGIAVLPVVNKIIETIIKNGQTIKHWKSRIQYNVYSLMDHHL